MQQEPNQPPITQPDQNPVDKKIAAMTNEVYTFEHKTAKHSLLDKIKSLSRGRKIMLLVGSCFVVFVVIIVIALSGGSQKQSSTDVAVSSGGSAKDNLTQYETTDVNGDGIVDQYDVSDDATSSDSTNDQSETSWWQKLINISNAGSSSSSNESEDETLYTDNDVAYENEGGSESEDSLEDDSVLDYLDNSETAPEDNDIDSSDPVDVPIADDPSPTSPAQTGDTITFASWNTLFSNSTSNVGKGVKAVAEKADIIGFQELHLSDRRKKMRDTLLCSSCAFSGYVQNYSANGSNPGSVAIVWRKSRFSVVKSGYFKVSDTQYVSTKTGSTGNKISSKWITWALLTDKKTGSKFYFMNTHTVASLESKGKPIASEKGRVKNYIHHMDVLTSKVKSFAASGLPIFITGDFNVNYRYDHKVQYKEFPFARLGAIGVHSDYQRLNLASIPASKASQGNGNRIIDYVWYKNNSAIYPISESISTVRYGSDHYPVYFTANVQ